MRVHAVEVGRLVVNRTFLRGQGWRDVLRRADDFHFPAYAFLLEHPDGPILIDTGMVASAWPVPGPAKRFVPRGSIGADEEIGPAMRARGLDPADVRTILITHLDRDHAGGVGWFPQAQALVHRPEHEFAHSRAGRMRERPQDWPESFRPTLYDFDGEPYGPFPASREVAEGVRLVPLPGHTPGQVGVVVTPPDGPRLLFAADHTLNQEWFIEDRATGRLSNIGFAARREYADTTRRVHEFVAQAPTVLVPSHDPGSAERLESRAPVPAP